MKKNKKTATVALAALLASSLAGQAFAAASFTDLQGVKNSTVITKLQERGVISGVKDGLFAPAAQVTAADGLTMIVNALRDKLNLDNVRLAGPNAFFPNVSDTAWYAYSFSVANYQKFGVPADINPTKPLTKEQFIFFLENAIEATGDYPMIKIYIPIEDEAAINPSYSGAIQRALIRKVTELDATGKFNPQTPVTRAEAATFVHNAMTYVEKVQALNPDLQNGDEAQFPGSRAISQIVTNLGITLPVGNGGKLPAASSLFSHIADDAWYAEAFVIAHEVGVDLPADIDPAKALTKEEYTFYLQQALEKSKHYPLIHIVPAQIKDAADLTPDYQGAIQRSLSMGFTALDADGNFLPKSYISQKDADAMLDKAIAHAAEHPAPGASAGAEMDGSAQE